jgi:hypothetical protein
LGENKKGIVLMLVVTKIFEFWKKLLTLECEKKTAR